MTRRSMRRAVPLCVLLAGLIAGHLALGGSAAHARNAGTDGRRTADAAGDAKPRKSPAREVAQGASAGRLPGDGSLSDVVALSARDIWAVGQQNVWDTWRNRGVISHWNGTSWMDVATRGDATGAGHLRSVAASSATEIWVVGDGHDSVPYVAVGSVDGFDRVNVPQLRVGDWLGGVAATGGRVVAVGSRDGKALMAASGGAGKGAVWTIRTGPRGTLYGVAFTGKSDGWAVGDSGTEPLVMRLSARGWKAVDLPTIKRGFLRDVYAESRKRAVAVGGVYRGDDTIAPLVLVWNGKKWSRSPVPVRRAELYGVTGDGDGALWVSGYDPANPAKAFLLRRDGSRWTVLRGQAPARERTVRLQAVAHVPGLTLAVGHVLDAHGRYRDLVERFGPPGPPKPP